MSMPQSHGQYVLSMIVPFVVQHPPEWHPIHHWWQCGQNCPCCNLPRQPIIQFPRIALLDQIQIEKNAALDVVHMRELLVFSVVAQWCFNKCVFISEP
jgi:hypothetical protein